MGSDSQLGVPKQYTLPQASWSVGTGVHIPTPQPNGGLQEQLNALHPGLAPIRTQAQYESTAYSSALQRQIAQAGRPSNLPVGAASLAGQYGFPQLAAQPTSRFQQPPAPANSAQLQALLAQLNQSRQQVPPYQAAALAQQMPSSLQTQLAQAREVSRPYGQNLNSLATPSHLQNPASALQGGMNRLGLPPTLQQSSSMTPAHYQALLRSLPSSNTSQLDQLLRGGPPLAANSAAAGLPGLQTPALAPSAAEDPLQTYLSGLANPPRGYSYGNQNPPSALPGGPSAAASLQYQMRLNNSLAGPRPMLPGPGRPPSMLGVAAGSTGFSSLQPARSPGTASYQDQLPRLDRSVDPWAADFRNLQQLLAAGGRDMPVDLLLKLQRETSQQRAAEAPKAADTSNAELQRLLASLGQNQPAHAHSQPPLGLAQPPLGHGQHASGQSQLPRASSRDSNLGQAQTEEDPIVQLRKQLSAQAGGLGSGQAEASRETSSKGPIETPFAQEAQHVPHGQSTFLDAFGRASRQSHRPEPTTAADNLATALSHRSATPASMQQQPSAAQPRMQSLAPNAADAEAKSRPSGWPESQTQQLQRDGSAVAPTAEVQANPAQAEGAASRGEPSGRDWGPFTGLGSASMGAPWSQPWGPVPSNTEQARPGPSRLGQATTEDRAANRASELDAQLPQVSGLSSFFQASNKQQKLGDTDWQAQLTSLQNASKAQNAQGPARHPSGSDFFSRPTEQQGWPGSSSGLPTPGVEARAPSSSLFADHKRPGSRQGIEQEPMIPSWLQTTSQGSEVWGAPNQPQQPQPGNPSREPKPHLSIVSQLIGS